MKKILIALVLGAALFYLFNPNNGEHHRSQIRNKAGSLRKNDAEPPTSEAA